MLKYYLYFLIFILIGCHSVKSIESGLDYKWSHLKEFEKSFSYIPSTRINNLRIKNSELQNTNDSNQYIFNGFNEDTIKVDFFYIFQYEVTNNGYLAFLRDIRKQDTLFYKEMLPNQEVWRNKFYYYEPFVEYYLLSPNYSYYPVVGVSYYQATEYCKWITKDYKKNKNRKFKNAVFKLPTKSQWLIAAIGKRHARIFPWDGTQMQKNNGEWLANFHKIKQVQISRDTGYFQCGSVNNYYDNCLVITADNSNPNYLNHGVAPVRSYDPNDYGLFNIVGNMSEYVREVGITKGGSWTDPGYYLQLDVEQRYSSIHSSDLNVGFRIVMEVLP